MERRSKSRTYILLGIGCTLIYTSLMNSTSSSESSEAEQASWFKTRSDIYDIRRRKLNATCLKYGKLDKPVNRVTLNQDVLWHRRLNFVYCPNGKTGTSTWMYNFLQLSEVPEFMKKRWLDDIFIHDRMRTLYNIPQVRELSSSNCLEVNYGFELRL